MPGKSGGGSKSGGGKRGARALHTRVRTAKGRRLSSTRWLERQLNDPYVAAAQEEGYRSRAAYKLKELNERFRLIPKQGRIVDLGAAPGGWTQVALEQGAKTVVAIDLTEVAPLKGAICLHRDVFDEGIEGDIQEALGGPADVVLSDMAAPSTGHKKTDHLRVMGLCEAALDLALLVLAPGGSFVAKVLRGGAEADLLATLKKNFASVRHAKPKASRADSAEIYVIAMGFRGSN